MKQVRCTTGFKSLVFRQCICPLNVFLHLVMEDAMVLQDKRPASDN